RSAHLAGSRPGAEGPQKRSVVAGNSTWSCCSGGGVHGPVAVEKKERRGNLNRLLLRPWTFWQMEAG
ncbi:MAG TPA: hypothetical protein VMK12_20910, partial [Anaeromyxobacteraceae bacterium]|nr:hypothetical protein [Anaeromyxobacteraceae bacterium]